MKLEKLGWASFFEEAFMPHKKQGVFPARVCREDKHQYLVKGESGEWKGHITGRFYLGKSKSDFPAVGDWVAVQP